MNSTAKPEPPKPRCVGRKKLYPERADARFPKGTLDRIEAVLDGKEVRQDFLRAAVERELRRRGAPPAKEPEKSS